MFKVILRPWEARIFYSTQGPVQLKAFLIGVKLASGMYLEALV